MEWSGQKAFGKSPTAKFVVDGVGFGVWDLGFAVWFSGYRV